MFGGATAFALLAANPIGGLLIAIPYAIFKLGWPMWLPVLLGIPLAYLQVLAVDLGWSVLDRWPAWHRFLQKRRSPRVERIVARRGFWLTVLFSPLVGPWLVMAFMRYACVPQRRVALPMLLGLSWNATAIGLCCLLLPRFFHI